MPGGWRYHADLPLRSCLSHHAIIREYRHAFEKAHHAFQEIITHFKNRHAFKKIITHLKKIMHFKKDRHAMEREIMQ